MKRTNSEEFDGNPAQFVRPNFVLPKMGQIMTQLGNNDATPTTTNERDGHQNEPVPLTRKLRSGDKK